MRKYGISALLWAVTVLAADSAAACSVCFGDPEHPQTHGMNLAILTLLGVTWSVLGAMAGTAFFLWRRTINSIPAGHGDLNRG